MFLVSTVVEAIEETSLKADNSTSKLIKSSAAIIGLTNDPNIKSEMARLKMEMLIKETNSVVANGQIVVNFSNKYLF